MNNKSLFTFIDFIFTKKKTSIYSSDPYLLFVRKLHEQFDESCLASRVADDFQKDAEYEWPSKLGFFRLVHKSTFQLFTKNILSVNKGTKDLILNAENYDALLLCWPHPISFLIARKFISKKKIFLLVRQNQAEITRAKYKGVKREFALMGLKFLDYNLSKWRQNLEIITVGEEMNKHFRERGFDSELIADSLIPQVYKGELKTNPNSIPHLLYVGRLEKEKGVDILLMACFFLKESGCNFQLKVIGTGSEESILKEQCNKLALAGMVDFVGHVKHGESLFSYFKESDLLVIPSRTEGFPKTIHEARAFGLPLVATPVGGMYAELKHGTNAWFSENTEPDSFANSILKLLSDHDSYASISKNLLKEFDESSMEYAITRYFNKITEHRSALLV